MKENYESHNYYHVISVAFCKWKIVKVKKAEIYQMFDSSTLLWPQPLRWLDGSQAEGQLSQNELWIIDAFFVLFGQPWRHHSVCSCLQVFIIHEQQLRYIDHAPFDICSSTYILTDKWSIWRFHVHAPSSYISSRFMRANGRLLALLHLSSHVWCKIWCFILALLALLQCKLKT